MTYPPQDSSYPSQQPGYQAYDAGTEADRTPAYGQGRPPSHGGWAVAAIVFFWPLAFVALSRSLEVYPLWAEGRHAEAQAASASVRKLGQISLWIFVGFIILYVVFMIAMVAIAGTSGQWT